MGDREVDQRAVGAPSLRRRGLKSMPLDAFLDLLAKEAAAPS
jgi:hypothetical protein